MISTRAYIENLGRVGQCREQQQRKRQTGLAKWHVEIGKVVGVERESASRYGTEKAERVLAPAALVDLIP